MKTKSTLTSIGLLAVTTFACSSDVEPGGSDASTGGASSSGGITSSGGTTPESGGAAPTGGGTSTGGDSSGVGGQGASTGSGGGSAGGGGASGGSEGSGGSADPSLPPPLVYEVENTGEDCAVASSFPSFGELESVSEFPDLFLMESGERISTFAEWRCRRAEIAAQIQHWEIGTKPTPAESEVSATYSGNTLTVNVTVGGQSIQLTTTINLPQGRSGPYPAVIRMAGSGVPIQGAVASMNFNDGQLAGQFPTRGQGPFWDLFPDDTVGAYAGWSWGVSRIIDGLELTADQNQIDTQHLAVTGCSYAGKMALWAAAFDERIALALPEESGGGGEASWRFMAGQPETEHLEAAQGTGWYSSNLRQFDNDSASKLPFDQHSLVAMIAPRAVLAIQNTGIGRLGSEAGGASMRAAAKVYEAMGIPERLGFTQAAAAGHCIFPSSQAADVSAFVDKFLLGKDDADTNIRKDSYNTDLSSWVPWEAPSF